jgi:hypothetical protein
MSASVILNQAGPDGQSQGEKMTLIKLAMGIPTLTSAVWFIVTGPPLGVQPIAAIAGVAMPGFSQPAEVHPQQVPSFLPGPAARPEARRGSHSEKRKRIPAESDTPKPDKEKIPGTGGARTGTETVLAASGVPDHSRLSTSEQVIARRLRIERLLMTLDHVTVAVVQMKPEHVDRIEPVIADLAEQAIDLVGDESVVNPETDAEITRIEKTVDRLVGALDRLVEPEASL